MQPRSGSLKESEPNTKKKLLGFEFSRRDELCDQSVLYSAMAYPGQYVNTHKGPESPYFALTRSQAPLATNTGPNSVPINVPLVSTNQPLLTSSHPTQTALRTTISPMASLQGSLYSPQPVKQISLKTGFTMPISDHIATIQQHNLPGEVANPVRKLDISHQHYQ